MFNKTKVALSLALVLGAASAAMAAPKHPVHHHQAAVVRQLPGASAFGFASSGSFDPALTSPALRDALRREAAGDKRCGVATVTRTGLAAPRLATNCKSASNCS